MIASIAFALAACSPSEPDQGASTQVGKPAEISHIHGLGIGADGTLYVATHFGLIRSGGNDRWVYASEDTNDHMGFSLHPGDGIMYRSGHSQEKPSLGVQSSTDGIAWTHLSDVTDPPVDFHSMAVSFHDSKTLWGWDSGGRGTFRSNDGGKTWAKLEARGVEGQIYALAGPPDPNIVLAGTASGLYRSTNGGDSWTPIRSAGKGWVIGIGVDPRDAKHLLASTESGMRVSRDRGASWKAANDGLPADAKIASLSISSRDGDVAYAADSSRIFKTDDGGETWFAVPTG